MKYIENFLSLMKKREIVINYIQVSKNGKLVDEYNRMNLKTRLNVYSVSKSITSLSIGIAIDEGLISLSEYIYPYFEEYIDETVRPLVKKIKVEHLLKMTCGLKEPLFFGDDKERHDTEDWLRYFFHSEFIYEPGTNFLYSNFNTYLLSCLLEKKSGMTLLEYTNKKLFKPIGINNVDWITCPKGHTYGANGLMLNIDEMTKVGKLLLNKGKYKGKQIISQKYLEVAAKNHIEENIPKFGYGYQFWVNPDGKSFRADGKYGQYIIVVPNNNLVVTMQALDSQKIFDDVWKELILPIINE